MDRRDAARLLRAALRREYRRGWATGFATASAASILAAIAVFCGGCFKDPIEVSRYEDGSGTGDPAHDEDEGTRAAFDQDATGTGGASGGDGAAGTDDEGSTGVGSTTGAVDPGGSSDDSTGEAWEPYAPCPGGIDDCDGGPCIRMDGEPPSACAPPCVNESCPDGGACLDYEGIAPICYLPCPCAPGMVCVEKWGAEMCLWP